MDKSHELRLYRQTRVKIYKDKKHKKFKCFGNFCYYPLNTSLAVVKTDNGDIFTVGSCLIEFVSTDK